MELLALAVDGVAYLLFSQQFMCLVFATESSIFDKTYDISFMHFRRRIQQKCRASRAEFAGT